MAVIQGRADKNAEIRVMGGYSNNISFSVTSHFIHWKFQALAQTSWHYV